MWSLPHLGKDLQVARGKRASMPVLQKSLSIVDMMRSTWLFAQVNFLLESPIIEIIAPSMIDYSITFLFGIPN